MTTSTGTHHEHNDNHTRAEHLLDDYLLDTLTPEDAAWMDAHVHECFLCRETIGPLMAAVQALPFSAPHPGVAMSDDLWGRIERSVMSAPPAEQAPEQAFIPLPTEVLTAVETSRSHRWTAREWLAIAAVALVSLVAGAMIGQAFPQVVGDDAADDQVIAIEFTDPDITASGELRYLPDEQVFVLEVTGLPQLPEGQVYQAWLIDGAGPVPVGVIGADAAEMAAVGNREAFQTFAITVEEGPLGNPAPTSDPVMVAALNGSGSN